MIDLVEEKIELTQCDEEPQIKQTNKLAGITKMVPTLNELDNSNNLKNRSSSNTLLTYHVIAYDDSTHFESYNPHHKKPKNGEIVSLTLRIKHMKNNIMTDGPATTVVFYIG